MIEPIWLLKYLPNMLACHISILIDCQGPSNTITEADASSNLAIAEAARIIGRGRADVMIAGGADSKIHPLSLVRMGMLDNMSRWKGEPSAGVPAVRSPSRRLGAGRGGGHRDSGGARARAERGARIHGEVLGGGSGCDAMPAGGLDPEGIGTEVAITAALEDAGLGPSDIGHVNAHGSATRVSDLAEARAFERIFGAGGVPVTALKGYMGNLVSGCGCRRVDRELGRRQSRARSRRSSTATSPTRNVELDLVLGSPRPAATRPS